MALRKGGAAVDTTFFLGVDRVAVEGPACGVGLIRVE